MAYWTVTRIANQINSLNNERTYGSQAKYNSILDKKGRLWAKAKELSLTDKVLELLGY